ncbi:endonuclease [bacterium]|nr:endonuclease [bacterium]
MTQNLISRYAILFILLFSFQLSSDGNTTITSFSKAKRILKKEIWRIPDLRKTVYCGCEFDEKYKVSYTSCGFTPRKNVKRAHRIEWEHVVPASLFGRHFKAWKEGNPRCKKKNGKRYKGRRCAKKVDKQFKLMEADMYNLMPAIGEVNGDRSNYPFGIIPGEIRKYGACDIEIAGKKAEPAPDIRGDIARVYFYMESAYPQKGIITDKNREMLQKWDKSDPVDWAECLRNAMIEKFQKNRNNVIHDRCVEMTEKKSLLDGIRWRISDEKKRELRNSLEQQKK